MDFLQIIFYILVVLFSVVLHEVSHGVVANSMGDNTAKDLGRTTLLTALLLRQVRKAHVFLQFGKYDGSSAETTTRHAS